MTKMLPVYSCEDCPYKRSWNMADWCTHPAVAGFDEQRELPVNFTIPEFCPLEDAPEGVPDETVAAFGAT